MTTALITFIITNIFTGRRPVRCVRVGAINAVFVTGILVLMLQMAAHGAPGMVKAESRERMPEKTAQRQVLATVVSAGNPDARKNFRIVLVCDSIRTRSMGLQGFRRLERDEAALFVFDRPQRATFWMGSVSFPIDIAFIGADKKVVRVYPDRRPGSTEHYPSIQPVKWVIETAAGSGISAGDRVVIN